MKYRITVKRSFFGLSEIVSDAAQKSTRIRKRALISVDLSTVMSMRRVINAERRAAAVSVFSLMILSLNLSSMKKATKTYKKKIEVTTLSQRLIILNVLKRKGIKYFKDEKRLSLNSPDPEYCIKMLLLSCGKSEYSVCGIKRIFSNSGVVVLSVIVYTPSFFSTVNMSEWNVWVEGSPKRTALGYDEIWSETK